MSYFTLLPMAKHDLEQDWCSYCKSCRGPQTVVVGDIKVWTDQIFGVEKPTPLKIISTTGWLGRFENMVDQGTGQTRTSMNTGDGVVDSAPGQRLLLSINLTSPGH